MSDLRPSPGPYKDVSPAGWPGLLAILVVMFGVVSLFVSREVAIELAWVIAGVVVVSLAWYLRSYFRSRHSLRDLRSDFAALKDFGAAAWLGILGILFIWVLLLNLTRPFEGIESWIFAAAALVALAFYIVSRLRER